MYMPRYDVILRNLNVSAEQVSLDRTVSIPITLLQFLLQIALLETDFNEEGYLEDNPDVAAAVVSGDIDDVRMHYIGHGYFECRTGGTPEVDSDWYTKTYPDVADAIREGKLTSAQAHFKAAGEIELRAPRAEYEYDAVHWGKALGRDNSGPV